MTAFVPREITESFRLERVLKSSTSGIVLRAADPATGAAVAIKLIPCGSPAHLEANQRRFMEAMGALVALRPPAFPRLIDHGFTPDGSAFLVMEFVEGTRFDALPPEPAGRLLGLVLGAVDGLEKLAEAGIPHGGIAPDNLFAVTTDDRESVRILGFGTSAYHAGEPPARADLMTGLDFRAPERLDPTIAVSEPDWRADVYSLALTAATMLRAQLSPLDSANPSVSIPAAATSGLADPTALRATLERALRRNPAERSSSWDEFRLGLRHALSGAPAAEAPAEVAAPVATAAPTALTIPEDSEDLQLEGAPPWLAEPGPASAPSPPGDRAAGAMEDTNPLPAQRLPAVGTGGGFPALPEFPPSSGWLDDGTTQQVNVAERLAIRDEGAPVGASFQRVAAEPLSADTKPAFIVPSAADQQPAPPPDASAPSQPATTEPAPEPLAAPLPTAPAMLMEAIPVAAPAAATPQAPAPEITPGVTAAAAARPTASARHAAASRRRSPLWAALTIVGVALIGGAAAVWFITQGEETKVQVAPSPTRIAARPTPTSAPASPTQAILQMQAAEHALTVSDWAAAGEALDAITSLEQVQLTPRDLERLRGLHESVDDLRRAALARDLRTGLLSSNLKLLGGAIRAMTKEDEATFARNVDLNQTVEEGRRAVNLHGLMLKAEKDGNWSQVLVNATSLLTILPRFAQASELREHAAASLEQEADSLAQRGRYEQALARLDTLGQLWADRPGLSARVERIRAAQAADARFATLLVSVEQTERDNAPEKGLELLRTVNPGPRWEERFRQARERLTNQLAALDKEPPVVALAKDAKLEYLKGKPAVLAFHITDDHAVKGARLYARVEGSDKYTELPLRQGSGADWNAEISFAFHQNNTVELFVVATDYSDHVGQLGSAQAPLKLKRKRNWLGL